MQFFISGVDGDEGVKGVEKSVWSTRSVRILILLEVLLIQPLPGEEKPIFFTSDHSAGYQV